MRHLPTRRSVRYALAGAGVGLVLVALLGATVGGFPSRPLFQAVTIGSGTAAGTGDVRVNAGSIGVGTAPSTTDGGIRLTANGSSTNTAAVLIQSATPVLYFEDTNSGADTKKFRLYADSNALRFDAHNDAESVALPFFTATNAGSAISNVALGPVGAANMTLDLASSRVAISSTAPRILWNDTDSAANEKLTECINSGNVFQCATRTDADGAGSIFLTMTRSGTTVSTLNLQGNEVQVNGLPISGSGAQGTFTASFDTACSTTPTVTYDWTRSGNLVVLYPVATAGFPCTGDSTSFVTTGAPVPAAIRPNTNADTAPHPGYTDNSVSTWAQVTVTSGGNISYNKCTALNTTCNGAGWTAANNRSAPTFTTIVYMLGNP